jgi:hypothetical protein
VLHFSGGGDRLGAGKTGRSTGGCLDTGSAATHPTTERSCPSV